MGWRRAAGTPQTIMSFWFTISTSNFCSDDTQQFHTLVNMIKASLLRRRVFEFHSEGFFFTLISNIASYNTYLGNNCANLNIFFSYDPGLPYPDRITQSPGTGIIQCFWFIKNLPLTKRRVEHGILLPLGFDFVSFHNYLPCHFFMQERRFINQNIIHSEYFSTEPNANIFSLIIEKNSCIKIYLSCASKLNNTTGGGLEKAHCIFKLPKGFHSLQAVCPKTILLLNGGSWLS